MDADRVPIDRRGSVRKKTLQEIQQQPSEPSRVINVKNAKKAISAVVSLQMYGPVDSSVFEDRKAKCLACPALRTKQKIEDDIGFCSECGCGIAPHAALSVKLHMPKATCPRSSWLPTNPESASTIGKAADWLLKKIIP